MWIRYFICENVFISYVKYVSFTPKFHIWNFEPVHFTCELNISCKNVPLHFMCKMKMFQFHVFHMWNDMWNFREGYYCVYLFTSFIFLGKSCLDIKNKGLNNGDGVYKIDPDGGSEENAFIVYCDMTSFGGGWTMCYTTDNHVNTKAEISSKFPYGTDGYRTNCNNIPVRTIKGIISFYLRKPGRQFTIIWC